MTETPSVNVNEADVESIQQLPGIGVSLAQRIVEGRPYRRVEDLLEVRGVGKATFEGIRPHLELTQAERKEADLELERSQASISKDGRERGLPVDEIDPKVEERGLDGGAARSKRMPSPKTLSRSESLWLVFGVGVIVFTLSILTTLAIMAGINNTLDFNRLESIENINSGLAGLEQDLADLSSSVESLDRRVQPLEGLSGRMVAVEEATDSIQMDVDEALLAVDRMRTELEFLQSETTRISERVVRFDNFLDGLEELLRVLSNVESVE